MLSTIRKFSIVSFFCGLMFFNSANPAFASEVAYTDVVSWSDNAFSVLNDNSLSDSAYVVTTPIKVGFKEPVNLRRIQVILEGDKYITKNSMSVFYESGNKTLDTDSYVQTMEQKGPYLYVDFVIKDTAYSDFNDVIGVIIPTAFYRNYLEINFFVDGVADSVAPSKITNISHVFNEDNSVTYQYDLPSDDDFSHLEIYQDNQLLKDDYKLNSIKISDLTPEMSYKFKFVSVDTSRNKSEPFISSVTAPSGPDLIPPLEVSEIEKVVSGTAIQFSYKLPIDDDFSHLQVWRNNVMIADNLKINSFNDSDLDYDTTYNYVFKSVDFNGNVSNGSSLSVKTMPYLDDVAPLAPVGVDVVNGNASLFLSWSASPENDVVGYNVYIDGIKRNGSPVAGNSFRMTNLVNGQEYSLQVSAVDTSGNESELTQTFVGVPDSAMLPVFKVDTDLSAVAKSTENWFSQLWLVTAFSASIPIAFFVGGRVKALFFA